MRPRYLIGSALLGLLLWLPPLVSAQVWTETAGNTGTRDLSGVGVINAVRINATTVNPIGQIVFPNGTAAAPSLVFASGNGLFSAGAGTLDISVSGSRAFAFAASDFYMLQANPTIYLGAASDVAITRDAANVLGLRNGTNAQAFRVYNTYTSAANFESLAFSWSDAGANVASISTQTTGGSNRNLALYAQSTLQLGAAGNSSYWQLQTGGAFVPSATTSSIGLSSAPAWIATAPTLPVFCTSPAIAASNGTAAFTITVGTACAGSTGSFTMPAATTGWVCNFRNVTVPQSNVPSQTGGTTTTVTVTNYARTTGLAANWADSNELRVDCTGY